MKDKIKSWAKRILNKEQLTEWEELEGLTIEKIIIKENFKVLLFSNNSMVKIGISNYKVSITPFDIQTLIEYLLDCPQSALSAFRLLFELELINFSVIKEIYEYKIHKSLKETEESIHRSFKDLYPRSFNEETNN